jgi:pantoate kinase
MKGSRGAGLSLTHGTLTKVEVEPSDQFKYLVFINEVKTVNAIVSNTILEKFGTLLSQPYNITVNHDINTPITAGFGSSGGGALTISLALNEALNIGLSPIKAAQIAHITEIECKTGLGSVYAAMAGGFGVLYKPGAPGIGRSITYEDTEDYSVVYLYLGPIQTNEALSNNQLRTRINQIGGRYVDELYRNLSPEKFMELSRSFTEYVGLVTPRLRRLFNATDDAGYQCTMAMFGEVLFSLMPKGEEKGIIEVLKNVEPLEIPEVCGIDKLGARIV